MFFTLAGLYGICGHCCPRSLESEERELHFVNDVLFYIYAGSVALKSDCVAEQTDLELKVERDLKKSFESLHEMLSTQNTAYFQ